MCGRDECRGGFKPSSANKKLYLFFSWCPPQSYFSALLAKACRHGDAVFDPEPRVPLQAVPLPDTRSVLTGLCCLVSAPHR